MAMVATQNVAIPGGYTTLLSRGGVCWGGGQKVPFPRFFPFCRPPVSVINNRSLVG